MINIKTKMYIDGFCRSVLLDWLDQSKYSNNKKIQDHIMYKLTYEQVLLLISKKQFIKEDATSDVKINDIENSFSKLFSYGAALFAAPPLKKYVNMLIQKGFKVKVQPVPRKNAFTQKIIKDPNTGKPLYTYKFTAQKGGKLTNAAVQGLIKTSGILTYMGVSLGISLLTKIIFSVIRQSISKCRKVCKQNIKKDMPNRSLLVDICISKCRLKDLKFHITKLRNEVQKCKTISKNPEECQLNIIKQISKLNKMYVKEKNKLNNLQKRLSS